MIASKYMAAVLIVIGAGCGASGRPRLSGASPLVAADRPVAIATMERIAVGAHGKIDGYIRGWPFADEPSYSGAHDPLFTYVVDFRIVQTPAVFGMPITASGVRRIYFHPEGVRIAFGDASRFINGDPVAVDQVRFTFDFMPDFSQMAVRMMVHQMSARPFDFEGRTITPPSRPDDSLRMFGRYSAQYNGFLLTTAGA